MAKIKLYHYSDKDIKNKLKACYYGHNYFTDNDRAITNIKRIFFYTRPEPEHLLKGTKFLYIVEFNRAKIYDLNLDPLKLKDLSNSIDNLLRLIQNRFYQGVKYNIGNIEIVNLFYDVKFTKKECIK